MSQTNPYAPLVSGSDLRGAFHALTPGIAFRAARAFVRLLSERSAKPAAELRVAVARDSRFSGPALQAAALAGIRAEGALAVDCGMATTPAMFSVCVRREVAADGAIMITASHLPADRNGMKFVTPAGGLTRAEVTALTEAMPGLSGYGDARSHPERLPGPEPWKVPFVKIYAESLRAMLRAGTGETRPLAGMRVVVDAACGAGGFFAGEVLAPLGADVSGSIGLEPDGGFPLHSPNPEDASAMAALCAAARAALDGGQGLGILFDADVDRAGFCDARGKPVARNRLIALCAALLLRQRPGATIVTDSATSVGLTRFIERLGGKHWRFKRGYQNVISEAKRLNAEGICAPIAIETSGHAAFADHDFLDDGAHLAAWLLLQDVLLRREGSSLFTLIEDFREPIESREVRIAVAPERGAELVAALRASKLGTPAPDDREGARLLLAVDGREGEAYVSARASVHDPVLVVMAESEIRGGLDAARAVLKTIPGMPEL